MLGFRPVIEILSPSILVLLSFIIILEISASPFIYEPFKVSDEAVEVFFFTEGEIGDVTK